MATNGNFQIVRCRACGGEMRRGLDKVHYVYPSPDALADMRVGHYYCDGCFPRALRRLAEAGILIEGPRAAAA